jgi:hypothetical protein
MRHDRQGGYAGKAHDLHTGSATANPRCHLNGSGEDASALEGHLDSREAARAARQRQTTSTRKTL